MPLVIGSQCYKAYPILYLHSPVCGAQIDEQPFFQIWKSVPRSLRQGIISKIIRYQLNGYRTDENIAVHTIRINFTVIEWLSRYFFHIFKIKNVDNTDSESISAFCILINLLNFHSTYRSPEVVDKMAMMPWKNGNASCHCHEMQHKI